MFSENENKNQESDPEIKLEVTEEINKNEENKETKYKKFFRKYLNSLQIVEQPKDFWKITADDIKIWKIQLIITGIVWIASFLTGSYITFLCHWDGPNYVYAAKTWYNIPSNNSNPWFKEFQYNASYFACHFPGFPLVIRIFSVLCLNEYLVGDILAIIFCSLLFPYVFRRFLIIYDLVSDPTWTTLVSLLLPLRFLVYKVVGSSEPLYMSYCYLALIFFKTDKLFMMLLAMWGACTTRIEGMSIVGTIGLSYLLKFDILRAIFTSLGFLGTASVFRLHYRKFYSYTAYFKFNQGYQQLIQFPPFHLFINSGGWNEIYPLTYNVLLIETVLLVGIFAFSKNCLPFSIYSTVYFIYISLLYHPDVYRYSLPAYVPCLLAALDPIFSNYTIKNSVIFILPSYIFIAIVYILGMLYTNRCWDQFFLHVCNPERWPY